MVNFGYTLMTEQSGPKDLVRYAIAAEQVGFDFEVSSDHFSPWLVSQGHAPYAWTVLGAVAQATSRVELATYVTCPIIRYHPAVVAQKAATMQVLSDGRFILGLGSGENLNEHITGEGWPPVAQRQEMLVEAATLIRELHTGELTTWEGDYFRVDSARIWDAPDGGVPLAIAVSGQKSIDKFAPLADHLVAVEPDPELIKDWDKAKGDEATRARSVRFPSAGVPIGRPRWRRRTISSAGSPVVGRSTLICRPRPASRAPVSSSAPRTSLRPSPAARISTRWPRRSASTSTPGSPTSRWFRSATKASPSFWSRRPARC